jgi:hypothetical protein
MLNRIEGYYMRVLSYGPKVTQVFSLPPLPRGTNVYATISLSWFESFAPPREPFGRADAHIGSWSIYGPDGEEQKPTSGYFFQNALGLENCASINFVLTGINIEATAQINIMRF